MKINVAYLKLDEEVMHVACIIAYLMKRGEDCRFKVSQLQHIHLCPTCERLTYIVGLVIAKAFEDAI